MVTSHPLGRYPILVDSVLLTLHDMAQLINGEFTPRAQKLALQYLVDRRDCPLCGAKATVWCYTYGGAATILRTHTARLHLTPTQRRRAINYALTQEVLILKKQQQQQAEEDDDDK